MDNMLDSFESPPASPRQSADNHTEESPLRPHGLGRKYVWRRVARRNAMDLHLVTQNIPEFYESKQGTHNGVDGTSTRDLMAMVLPTICEA
jgi:hypothetical protein